MDIKKIQLFLGINSVFSLGGLTTYLIKYNYGPFGVIGINMTRNLVLSYSIYNLVLDRKRIFNKKINKNK
jgi:hypothetical protein